MPSSSNPRKRDFHGGGTLHALVDAGRSPTAAVMFRTMSTSDKQGLYKKYTLHVQVCAGRGICDQDTLKCQCYAGFDGPDCAVCAKDHMLTHGGFCVARPDRGMCGVPGTSGNATTQAPPTDQEPDQPTEGYNRMYSDWTDCTEPCGGGTEERTWECMDPSGEKAGAALV